MVSETEPFDVNSLLRCDCAAVENQTCDKCAVRGHIAALTKEVEELKSSVIAFAGPHAARYAEEFGLAKGELHPKHYDILERCGARMDDFRRADSFLSTERDATVSGQGDKP